MPQSSIPVSPALPYIIRPGRKNLVLKLVIFIVPLAMIAFALAMSPPGQEIANLAIFLLFAAMLMVIWLIMTTLEFRLSEDRLSYRILFTKKEMEYSSMSAISFCSRYVSGGIGGMNKPFMEIQGSHGENLSINLHLFCNDESEIRIIHDILKRKAPRAMTDRSFEEIFPQLANPDEGSPPGF